MALLYGGRGLNAVLVPGVVALFAAVVQVRLIDRPTLSRRVPSNGSPGEERTVELQFEAGRQLAAHVEETVGDGLAATGNSRDASIGDGEPFTYEVVYERRGEYGLGPTRVTVTDLFGLVERTYVYWNPDTVTIYPPRKSVPTGVRSALSVCTEVRAEHRRGEFDQLREYQRGDPLRDVHWKSSAKLPTDKLLLTELTATERRETVRVVAQTMDQRADELAVVTASVVTYLLDCGATVGLTTAEGRVEPDGCPEQRDELLSQLAVLGTHSVPPARRAAADVYVYTPVDGSAPIVSVDGDERRFTTVMANGVDDGPGSHSEEADASDGRFGIGEVIPS
jgi:uncharacterized protein (DUF58 family)